MLLNNFQRIETRFPINHPVSEGGIVTGVWGYYMSIGRITEYFYDISEGRDVHLEYVPVDEFSIWLIARAGKGMADLFTKIEMGEFSELTKGL